jgi:glycosyltransferase involved in cell wall biosynthesis
VALVGRRRPVRLLVLGEGSERRRLEALARRLGVESDVALPGYAENPYPLMARAAVVALSSLREGLPTVLIEALALGRPVVATDCPTGPREILEDGRLGRLVPPGDVDALAAALEQALAAGPPIVPTEALARYDPERVADRYLELARAAA